MIYVEATNEFTPDLLVGEEAMKRLFLAGGITGCPDWQYEMRQMLEHLDIVVFNPRRAHFDVTDVTASKEQIEWEYDQLYKADAVLFWFCKETLQPIALFELGSMLNRNGCSSGRPEEGWKKVVIGIEPGYLREEDIRVQTALLTDEVEIVDNLPDLAHGAAKLLGV